MKLTFEQFHRIYAPFFRFFRSRRMKKFQKVFQVNSNSKVLDVGGSKLNWSFIPAKPRLTILNIELPENRSHDVDWIVADGRFLPFSENAFDVVYSNSVIEHLYTKQNQEQFSQECRRVGQRYYIQTPNLLFPIEPHFLGLFLHWFPKSFRKRLIPYLSLRGLLLRPSKQQCSEWVEEIRLVDQKELQSFFPDATIWKERLLGFTKSLIAVQSQPKQK